MTKPDINASTCLHARSAASNCSACADACPQEALSFEGGALLLHEELCNGCGLCRPACPENAVYLAGQEPVIAQLNGADVAFAACSETEAVDRSGILSCVDSISLHQIFALYSKGVRRFVLTRAECRTCDRGERSTALDERIDLANRLLASRNVETIPVRTVDREQWVDLLRQAKPSGPESMSRRQLLFSASRAINPQVQPGPAFLAACQALQRRTRSDALYAFVPEIDPECCIGCDACVRLCPHQALKLMRQTEGLAYQIRAENCTGCHLCVEHCQVNAVRVGRMQKQSEFLVSLDENRCRACGNLFHLPTPRARKTPFCPVCQKTPHQRNLFVVY